MNRSLIALLTLTASVLAGGDCRGSAVILPTVVIEPDDFPDGTVLNDVAPSVVTLSTGAFSDNRPTFDITAATDAADASTGVKVFAHAGVRFFSTGRTFRMDFPQPPRRIELDYISSGFASELYLGRIEGYDTAGNLVAFDETALLASGQSEALSLSAPGIAYALAFPPEDPFGDFDFLRITVPEPGSLGMGLLAVLGLAGRPGRRPA